MQRPNIDGKIAHSLYSVYMQQNPFAPQHFSDTADGIDGSHFIIGHHHTDQNRIRSERPLQRLQKHHSLRVHRQIRYTKSLSLQMLAGVQYRMMLYRRRYDMPAACSVSLRGSFDSPVIRLGSATCKKNLLR